ncbi:MAG: phenylalanine--tRNA ligase subunit beta [Candidatus Baltobacteraceae bacterium]
MLVPIGWLRDYVQLPDDPHAIAQMLAQIGFPVESVDERPRITGVVVGRIADLGKHPNADRLQVGTIDIGNGAALTIATAATNVAAGQTIPVAVIGAQLPNLKIERRKMRGLESEGMMISAEELALPAEWFEDGIMQLEPALAPGTDVVEHFRLSDAVLDVEVTGNRVDAMSITGLARELAAFQGIPLRLPQTPALEPGGTGIRVSLESEDCMQFVGARIDDVRTGASPAWMRLRLALAGQRPVGNLVDISNYVMLETGQPLHFYDAQKVADAHLIVRDGGDDERLQTLDGKEREISPNDLLVATLSEPAAFAGLMGGAATEVSAATQSILLESATFSGPRVRRMSARHGLRTEASTRNEKTLPPALAHTGAARAVQLLTAQGAHVRGVAFAGEAQTAAPSVHFELREVKRLLGFSLTLQETSEYLDRLGFVTQTAGENALSVTPPPWRRDVSIAADIVEELARMAGYERIEAVIPSVAAHDIRSDVYRLETRIARSLAALGYNEIVTIALHGAQVIDKLRAAGFAPGSTPVEVLNPLSEDQRYLRFSLGPAHLQYFARLDRPARAFEIGHVFHQDDGGPMEAPLVAFSFAAEPQDEPAWRDSSFLKIKGDAEALLHALTGRRDVEWAPDQRNGAHPGKTAAGLLDGREAAFVCQVDPRMQQAFGVRLAVYGCWIYLQRIPEFLTPRYAAPSKYPGTYRDLALVCDPDVAAGAIETAIRESIGGMCTGARTFDEYRGPQIAAGKKSLAVRVTLVRDDRTITDEDADKAVELALARVRDEFGVALRT